MDDGVADAFCPILWRHNGGATDRNGRAKPGVCGACNGVGDVNGSECSSCNGSGHDSEARTRGYCTRAYDCADCRDFQYELSFVPPDQRFWLCPDCVVKACKEAREKGIAIQLPGFYNTGYCQSPHCTRPGAEALGIPPRASVFTQIVFGPLFRG